MLNKEKTISRISIAEAIALPDLTDPRHGIHAMQLLLEAIHTALALGPGCQRQLVRSSPVIPLENNYDRLGYPPEGAARDARYTRYLTDKLILRTQTSSAIPDLLSGLIDPPSDLLLILPGLVYRRDCIDKLHCAEPHQLDLWRIVSSSKSTMGVEDLALMIARVMQAAVPGKEWKLTPSPHPYTQQGVQIDVSWHDTWVEVGECGLAAPVILKQAGLTTHTGLAMGLGLDRLLMIRKNIPDIRLLRASDPRIREQMLDLSPYRPVSLMPSIRRDLSLCVISSDTEEEIGDRIRENIQDVAGIESILVKSEAPYDELPDAAHERMGMKPEHKNILLQLTLRPMDRTMTDDEANAIRNDVYKLLHLGDRLELA